MPGFIGVHVGAGSLSAKRVAENKKVCREACKEANAILKRGGSAVEAVTAATAVLENCPITNAGIGSNLTWDGNVECDAMIMDGRTLRHGAVGAVTGLKNPVNLARVLCDQRCSNHLPLGRVPPSLLVGEGAVSYAKSAGLAIVPPSELITARSLKLYKHHKKKIERFENATKQQVPTAPMDTVGAVSLDFEGHVAAACSSGGIAIKYPGRVGQAAIFGCGCWAQDGEGDIPSVASTTTGCGEHLVSSILAREVALGLQASSCPVVKLHDIMKKKFLESPFLHGIENKLGGVATLRHTSNEAGEFLWAHSTSTMCVGYMRTTDNQPTSRLSSLPTHIKPGSKVVVEGISF